MNFLKKIGRGFKGIILLTILLAILVFAIATIMKNVIQYEDTEKVMVFKNNFDKGEQITSNNIDDFVKEIKISKSEVPPTIIKNKTSLNGLYINEDIYEGEYITKNTVNIDYPFVVEYDIPEGKSLVSIKFERGDSANAWNVFENQEVKIVYTPSLSSSMGDSVSKYYNDKTIDATVYSIKDSQYYVNGESLFDPTKLLYITFLVSTDDAIFLSRTKEKGRVDIIQ